jgi:hypothetical protein
MCGINKIVTSHHAIPSHFKPKHNVVIPLCEECHKLICLDDLSGIYGYVHKLEKNIRNNNDNINETINILNKVVSMRKNNLI